MHEYKMVKLWAPTLPVDLQSLERDGWEPVCFEYDSGGYRFLMKRLLKWKEL